MTNGSTPPASGLDHVREIALALPEVDERMSHGAPCCFVRGRRPVCYFHDADFGDRGRVSLMCPAPRGAAEMLTTTEPGRFYRPTPSASGVFEDWLGVYLDGSGPDRVGWPRSRRSFARRTCSSRRRGLVARLDEGSIAGTGPRLHVGIASRT